LLYHGIDVCNYPLTTVCYPGIQLVAGIIPPGERWIGTMFDKRNAVVYLHDGVFA
jgi:hypothetical protein